jgi:hypothetical protein
MKWIIVGGGIHGTTIASALLRYGYGPEQLQIIDSAPRPLFRWEERIDNCGMHFLRSPAAHGILPEFSSLRRWAKDNGYGDPHHFRPPYSRPSVQLFVSYTRWAVEQTGIAGAWTQNRVTSIKRSGTHWKIALADGGERTAENVILATGRSDSDGNPMLNYPEWAEGVPGAQHILAPDFDRNRFSLAREPLIVGGGATAIHLAVTTARHGQPVRVVVNHPLRVHQFDSEPCYIGPQCYSRFLKIRDPELRRAEIDQARHPGSVPPDLFAEFTEELHAGRISLINDTVTDAASAGGVIELRGANGHYTCDALALGTGFSSDLPAARLLSAIQSSLKGGLPRDLTGAPIPDESLQWAPGIFLTGVLGELELGPTAPNIIGAHNAAKRIISFLEGRTQRIPRSWHSYLHG